ncbi:cupin domain-containing protein [Lacihabitans sp. LS3-19]|uniref:cupin domain-containing protein n=1 Tax=Lacihabitans sp. LS3-19 TaxID=2487335 RepID=UPI0020CDD9DD|nr:cupin domain-containing protein [Lacihabitans sp. LS3-19]MCP9769091.1 cupin domain-containing protein [Lacihabitans sp. LS3-19]
MNLKNAFLSLEKYFSPKIIGEVNDQYIKVVKIKGQEVPWHIHENEDELFYIAKGTLLMEIENQPDLKLKKGDLFVVNKGKNHRVSSEEECLIMLIESKTTEHTGKIKTSITKSVDQQFY